MLSFFDQYGSVPMDFRILGVDVIIYKAIHIAGKHSNTIAVNCMGDSTDSATSLITE